MRYCFVSMLCIIIVIFMGSDAFGTEPCQDSFRNMEYEKAIKECTKAINAGKNTGAGLYEYYTTRGLAYKILRKYNEALSDLTSAVEAGTDNKADLSFLYNDRGSLYHRKDMYNKAISDFYFSIYLNPDSYTGMYNIARSFSRANRADLSCKWLRKSREKGFSIWKQVFTKEKDFDAIRNAKCFKEIMAEE